MVTRLAGRRNATVSVVVVLGCAAALTGGCGEDGGNSAITCALPEHCAPHGLVCDVQLARCVPPRAGGSGSGGQANGGSGGKGSGGSMSSGGKVGSGGTVGGSDGMGGAAGSEGGGAGTDGGAGDAGTNGTGGAGGNAGTGGVSGSAGTGGVSGSAGASGAGGAGNGGNGGNAGPGGSAGNAGAGGTGGNGGNAGSAGGSAGAGGGGGLVGYHEDTGANVDAYPHMDLQIRNLGPTFTATNVVIRYYFSVDPIGNTYAPSVANADFSSPYVPLTDDSTAVVMENPSPKAGADRILQITITRGFSWTMNATLGVQVYALPTIFSGTTQTNDYSYADHAEPTVWDRFTVTVDGNLLWGVPP